MPWQPSEIGPKYDFGISTRDGSTISVLDKDGRTRQISSLAFMTTVDKQNPTKEATELQEKDKLVQFGSSALIDREFDQWPQVTQGDWSGGIGQRVFGSGNDQTRYWDGHGLCWPLADTVPSIPIPVDTNPATPATIVDGFQVGPVGGWVAGIGVGYAMFLADTPAGGSTHTAHVRFYSGTITGAPNTWDVVIGAAAQHQTCFALAVGLGSIWALTADPVAGGNVTLNRIDVLGAGTLQVSASVAVVANLLANSPVNTYGSIAVAGVASKAYAAVALDYEIAAANRVSNVYIYDVSATPPFGAATTIAFPSTLTNILFSNDSWYYTVNDLAWVGDTLFISASDRSHSYILSSSAPFSSTSTAANLSGAAFAFICGVGGTLFIETFTTSIFNIVGGPIGIPVLYTLTGGILTEIGPIYPRPFATPIGNRTPMRPVGFGDYAVFAIQSGSNPETYLVYAYDVVRTRLFHVLDAAVTAGGAGVGISGFGTGLGVVGAVQRQTNASAFYADWGLVLYNGAGGGPYVQEFYFGVQDFHGGVLRHNVDITSGIIDFTAATIKLFRQVVAGFIDGLISGQASPSVTLNLWFDKMPDNLGAADVSVNTGVAPTPLPSILDLNAVANHLGRKIVYQVITSGAGMFAGTTSVQSASILDEVIIQAATGWVWDMNADLSPNVRVNAQNTQEYCFQIQGVDHVAAYNFLKQLWRQKGGEIILTLPNLDSYAALIQQIGFTSPKPFAASFRSDQQSTYQSVATLKIREDV